MLGTCHKKIRFYLILLYFEGSGLGASLILVLQGEVEADMCELQHRVRAAGHELQLAREREEQLKQDLHTERTALDQLGVSALSRSNVSPWFDVSLTFHKKDRQ